MAQARRTADFADTIGINVHVTQGGQYSNTTQLINDLNYLGSDLVRDNLPGGNTSVSAQMDRIAKAGVEWDFIGSGTPEGTVRFLQGFQARNPGALNSVEGPNETNNFAISYAGKTGSAAGQQFTNDLLNLVNSNQALDDVPVYNFTTWPNVGSNADYGNVHIYPPNGNQPVQNFVGELNDQKEVMPGKPVVVTESHYYTKPGYSNAQWVGVDEASQAKMTLNLLMRSYDSGVSEIYLYQLYDQFAPSQGTNEAHYGLYDFNGNPKPAATALHNFTSILKDGGAGAETFQPGTLDYSISGLPSTGGSALLQKSNGAFNLVVWDEPDIWDQNASRSIDTPAKNVTVDLGGTFASVNVYDPLVGTAAVKTYSNVSSLTLSLDDHPLVIEVANGSTPTPASETPSPPASTPIPDPTAAGEDDLPFTYEDDGPNSGLGGGTGQATASGNGAEGAQPTEYVGGGHSNDATANASAGAIGQSANSGSADAGHGANGAGGVGHGHGGGAVAPAGQAAEAGAGTDAGQGTVEGEGAGPAPAAATSTPTTPTGPLASLAENWGDDVIDGSASTDHIHGGHGDDVVSGHEGADSLTGDDGDDILLGGVGADRMSGNRGEDALFGGAGHDILEGGSSNDLLVGGTGSDTIDGGTGLDALLLSDGIGDYMIAVLDDNEVRLSHAADGTDVVTDVEYYRFLASGETYVVQNGVFTRTTDTEAVDELLSGHLLEELIAAEASAEADVASSPAAGGSASGAAGTAPGAAAPGSAGSTASCGDAQAHDDGSAHTHADLFVAA